MGDEIVTTDNEFGMGLVNMVKMSLSVEMADWHERLLTLELPQRENYAKEEDYKEAVKLVMIQAVNVIQKLKGDTFRELLETYNLFLNEKSELDEHLNNLVPALKENIEFTYKHNKFIGILMLVLTVIFPSAFPFILLINVPRMILNNKSIKKMSQEYKEVTSMGLLVNDVQRSYYDVVFDLRNDFHRSNEELDNLRERAQQGENIMAELLEIVNPERANLPSVIIRHIDCLEEPQKTIKKEKDN